ncbi:hypothetical protein PhCBS80983_g00440 [Powellomyces hirtus]|uniref:Uncharacterized protein n=1 Tax=Powellomyces hirtus TaxID=109895 RepID=A0A507EGM1_9FUNG|nr:hypothetical protein PhCBS80983_g00440 [Powellomyces hirtus]
MKSSTAAKYATAHRSPKGPGDSRPTAMDIIRDENLIGKLADKVILITGASSGIGIETARALHATGAHLFFGVRNVKQGDKVAAQILSDGGSGKIDVLEVHLDDLGSVRRCAAEFARRSKQLNVFIANAGVMACPESKTKDGYEMQFATNHLGHFLFFQLLKPILLASSTPLFNSRVVVVSSNGHRTSPVMFDNINFENGGYHPRAAYGQSKTANIHFANEIERRFGSRGLHATSLHPGGIATPIQRHLDSAALKKWESPEIQAYLKNPAQGAATTVWAAVGKEREGKGGAYLDNLEEVSVEDVALAGKGVNHIGLHSGYAAHAFDQGAELKLWDLSNELVGFLE